MLHPADRTSVCFVSNKCFGRRERGPRARARAPAGICSLWAAFYLIGLCPGRDVCGRETGKWYTGRELSQSAAPGPALVVRGGPATYAEIVLRACGLRRRDIWASICGRLCYSLIDGSPTRPTLGPSHHQRDTSGRGPIEWTRADAPHLRRHLHTAHAASPRGVAHGRGPRLAPGLLRARG